MAYNASVREFYLNSGEYRGVFVAEVIELNGRPQMVRSNAVQCTGYEGRILTSPIDIDGITAQAGDSAYDFYMRAIHADLIFVILQDDCKAYRDQIGGLHIPPTYKG